MGSFEVHVWRTSTRTRARSERSQHGFRGKKLVAISPWISSTLCLCTSRWDISQPGASAIETPATLDILNGLPERSTNCKTILFFLTARRRHHECRNRLECGCERGLFSV